MFKNTFENFTLQGANVTRYVPILCDAKKMVAASKKVSVDLGQLPLFLLDGLPTERVVETAKEKLGLVDFVMICRPYDIGIRKEFTEASKKLKDWGYLDKDGGLTEEALITPKEFKNNWKFFNEFLALKKRYQRILKIKPIDVIRGKEIKGDLNEYLFNFAKELYPIGIESVLENNTKQSAILKPKSYQDGLRGDAPPKGIRCNKDRQLTLLYSYEKGIDSAIEAVVAFVAERLKSGYLDVTDVVKYCAELGFYKNNITLYIIGAAFTKIDKQAIFFDGLTEFIIGDYEYMGVLIPTLYDFKLKARCEHKPALIYFDNTDLKDRLSDVFSLEDKSETLSKALYKISRWIRTNLSYPVAFLDEKLQELLSETISYGERLQEFDQYFTDNRCDEIKKRLPQADKLALETIEKAIGITPLPIPKLHYGTILWDKKCYLSIAGKEKPEWARKTKCHATSVKTR